MEKKALLIDNVSSEAWEEFKKNASEFISPERLVSLEADLPSLTLRLWSDDFMTLVKGIRSNSIPATHICVYFRNSNQRVGEIDAEVEIRVQSLIEALEKNNSITSAKVPMARNNFLTSGYEPNVIRFFDFFGSPLCRLDSLEIISSNTTVANTMLTAAFKNNTTLRKLMIRSNSSETWTCLKTLDAPLETLCLDLELIDHSKQGMKAAISALKNLSASLTRFEFEITQAPFQTIIDTNISETYKPIYTQLSKMKALRHIKLWGTTNLLADVLISHPTLETAILFSDDTTYSNTLLKALNKLSQNSLKKLVLNVNNGPQLISALENNTTITDLEIRNDDIYNLDTGRILSSMKSLKDLSLLAPQIHDKQKIQESESSTRGGTADWSRWLTILIGPESPLRILRIYQYPYIPTEEFLTTLKTNTSLIRLELLAPSQRNQFEFISALQMNPYLEIIWTQKYSVVAYGMKSLRKANIARLKNISSVLTLLQTILLPKDRGILSSAPIEVLFNILKYFTFGAFRNKELAVLFETASQRDWILGSRDTKDKLRCLWQKLVEVGLRNENKKLN